MELPPHIQVHNPSLEEISFLRQLQHGTLVSKRADEPPDHGEKINHGFIPTSSVVPRNQVESSMVEGSNPLAGSIGRI